MHIDILEEGGMERINIKTVTAVQYSAVQCSAIQYIKTIERNE